MANLDDVRGWTWGLAKKLQESGHERELERLLTDLRGCTTPEDFSNALVQDVITLSRSGANLPQVRKDLLEFSSISEFKKIKAVVLATIYNATVQQSKGESG